MYLFNCEKDVIEFITSITGTFTSLKFFTLYMIYSILYIVYIILYL